MYFTGTDIIEVERVKKAMEDVSFILRVFTQNEIEYCEKYQGDSKYQHYAARFAGKEAIFKAISVALKSKFDISWQDIEIGRSKDGKPLLYYKGSEEAGIVKIGNITLQVDVSLSHIKDYAIATAVADLNVEE